LTGETVAVRFVVALKRGKACGAKDLTVHDVVINQGGKGEMTKAPIRLQNLRQRLYVKAKA